MGQRWSSGKLASGGRSGSLRSSLVLPYGYEQRDAVRLGTEDADIRWKWIAHFCATLVVGLCRSQTIFGPNAPW